MHSGWFHLIFNMIFLWTFGLIAEGYVGWRRFLPVYLLAAVIPGAITQLLMLGKDTGGAVGASAAVYGTMAIAALWAPMNRLTVFVWIVSIIRKPEVSVWGFCLLWVGLDVLFAVLLGFVVSTPLVHLMGAGVGVAAAVHMLKKGWADCEGWDYFSLRAKRAAASERPRPPTVPDGRVEMPEVHDSLVRVRDYVDEEDGLSADATYEQLQQREAEWLLPRGDLLKLTQILLRTGMTERAFVRLEEFLRAYPEGSESARLTLATHLLRAKRPGKALEHLQQLPAAGLTETQQTAKAHLEAEARSMLDRSGLELE